MSAHPQAAVQEYLIASELAGIDWGTDGKSPFYQGLLDQPPDPLVSPYVVIDFPPSTGMDPSTEDPYAEEFSFEVRVFGPASAMETLGNPYVSDSVFAYLDRLCGTPELLSGDYWRCFGFLRGPWQILQDSRGTTGAMVFRATASYRMRISVTPPQ